MKFLPFYILAFAFSLVWLVGGVWLTVYAIRERADVAESANWPNVACTVTSFKIVHESGTGGIRHKSLDVKCAYPAGAAMHELDCGQGVGLEYTSTMQVGSVHQCQVDPSNPERAVFENAMFLHPKTGLALGPIFAAVGLAMVYGLFRTLPRDPAHA